MSIKPFGNSFCTLRLIIVTGCGLLATLSASAQLPADVVNEARAIAGTRTEAFDILGGDYGLNGGSYKGTE